MKVKNLFLHKQSILLWISVLTGFFIAHEEIIDYISISNTEGVQPGGINQLLIFIQCLAFILFTRVLLQINVCWCPKKGHIKQFAYSWLASLVFYAIVMVAIAPIIEEANQGIRDQYEQREERERAERSQRGQRGEKTHKREGYSREKKIFYHFHEPQEAWVSNIFTLFLIVYTLSRIYILSVRKEEIEKNFEKLKNESLQSRLDALHNQINPHFFFNALNSLHALIAEGQNQKSLTYLSNLSNLFRYILQSEKKELVSLKDELAFLDTYRFMLSVKYEEKLRFDILIDPEYTFYQLPVLSLLPLVENVIKHNEISTRNPMTITIESTREPALTIRNKKQEKLDEVEKGGIGLRNLNNRFLLLFQKEVKIENTPEYFSVTLPLKPNA